MKKVIYILAVTLTVNGLVSSHAAPPPTTNLNELARIEQEKKGYMGNFTHVLEEKYQINVNYSFTPKVPTNEVEFLLHTPEPRPLSLAIKDANGKVVLQWAPENENYLHEGKLDVSKLKKGKYTYVIMWDGVSSHEIDFEKK